ncbi:MAG: hypothetical protein PHN38_02350 [Sulfurospirillaceae bacterium]|nr:hypothetical protein [Sulfurospirillaceae bacterium]
MKKVTIILLCLFFITGCTRVVSVQSINPKAIGFELPKTDEQKIQTVLVGKSFVTYDTKDETITEHKYALKDGKLVVLEAVKIYPKDVEYMNKWVTGLGHELLRLSNQKADSIEGVLDDNAKKQGYIELHKGKKDFLIDKDFFEELKLIIDRYEETINRYNRNDFIVP